MAAEYIGHFLNYFYDAAQYFHLKRVSRPKRTTGKFFYKHSQAALMPYKLILKDKGRPSKIYPIHLNDRIP